MVRGRGGYSGGGGYANGGRGSSSGSGRGGSYRGSSSSYYNSRSGGSGRSSGSFVSGSSSSHTYNNSHSRGNYTSGGYNNYDSKSRDRLSSSRHTERHDEHKRPYRAQGSRDRSPERKRSRHEDTRINNYSSSTTTSSSSSYRRNEPSRNSRQTPPVISSSSGRQSVGTYRSSHRDESSTSASHHRNSNHQNDSMGPPKSLPPRSRIVRSSRGVPNTRLRGSVTTRPRNVRIIRARRDTADMQIMRKKLLLAHQRDRARRIKIARLTSSLRKRDVSGGGGSRRKLSTSSSSARKIRSDKKDDEGRSSKTIDDIDVKKKSNASIKIKTEPEDEDDDELQTEGNIEKGEEIEKDDKVEADKEDKSETGGTDIDEKKLTKKKDKDEKERKTDRDTKSNSPRKLRKSFIKLTCVHCRTKCLTFQEYSNHLYYRVHKIAMRRLALRQKAQLSQMRLKQRNAQRDIEQNAKDDLEDFKPQFCLLCRLNYRQAKAKHQLSEHHRNMKKFLMPYCSTCHIAFKSPMMYEAHRCSLEHIKRKARNNETHSENSGDEKEVDLANFMTVDSVGEIDGIQNEDEIDEEALEEDEDEKDKMNVGADHVKKTEAFYCDLCRIFFHSKDDDEILKKHCSTRSHLKAFIRYKEDLDLQAVAERVLRKESKDKKKDDNSDKNTDGNDKDDNAKRDDADGQHPDKLWEAVDKDLGELLREVGPEDDEEDGSVLNIDIERFDKFKNSEKAKAKEMNGKADSAEIDEQDDEDDDDEEEDEEIQEPDSSTVAKSKKDIKPEDNEEASI